MGKLKDSWKILGFDDGYGLVMPRSIEKLNTFRRNFSDLGLPEIQMEAVEDHLERWWSHWHQFQKMIYI